MQVFPRNRYENRSQKQLGMDTNWAAKNGHAEVCKLIAAQMDDKNPKANDGVTTPHSLLSDFFLKQVFVNAE